MPYGFELIEKRTAEGKKRKTLGHFNISELVAANVPINESYTVNIGKKGIILTMLLLLFMFIWGISLDSGQTVKEPIWKIIFLFLFFGCIVWYMISMYIKSGKNPYLLINAEGIMFKEIVYRWDEIELINCHRYRQFNGTTEDLELYLKDASKLSISFHGNLTNQDIGIIAAYVKYYQPARREV